MNYIDIDGSSAGITFKEGTSLQNGYSGIDQVNIQNGGSIVANKAIIATGPTFYTIYNNGSIYLNNSAMGCLFLDLSGEPRSRSRPWRLPLQGRQA